MRTLALSDTQEIIPAELVLESASGRLAWKKDFLPGRHHETIKFILNGVDKPLLIDFTILKNEAPILNIDTDAIDFGSLERGRSVTRRIRIRNPGYNSLRWKITRSRQSERTRYVSLLNSEEHSGDYRIPVHLQESLNIAGSLYGENGFPRIADGTRLNFSFTGTGLEVRLMKDIDLGTVILSVDGGNPVEVDCASGKLESSIITVARGLPEGPHSILMSKQGGSMIVEGFRVSGGNCMTPPSGWIKIYPDNGATLSQTSYITLSANTTGMYPGFYCDEMIVESNGGAVPIGISVTITAASVPQLLRLFKFTRGDDVLFSSNPEAEDPRKFSGYTKCGVVFRLFREDTPGTKKLYRWYSQARVNHYYSMSAEGDKYSHGYVLEGPIGNVATSRLPGTRELYHWFNPATGLHFYTTDPKGEWASQRGFRFEATVGFIK